MSRQAAISRLVGEIAANISQGPPQDLDAIVATHDDLMPELGVEIRKIRRLMRAKQSADSDCVRLDDDLVALNAELPNYEVFEEIDYGGQGRVFRGQQLGTQRTVAIKVLLDGPLSSTRQRRRFEREVELMGRMADPGIVSIYDSGHLRGRPYFVMEYVEGVAIDDFVLAKGLPVRAIVRVMCDVARAVSRAHQHGVIHRDLKPANILIDEQSAPHILDFGLAKAVEDPATDSISRVGGVVGTLPYLSPEQADGSTPPDVRADIYALGVVLFELLTGEYPFDFSSCNREEALRKISDARPETLTKALANTGVVPVRFGINDDLEKIAAKALEKDPQDRYQSASEFADELDRWLAGDAVLAKSSNPAYVLRKLMRRFRLQIAIVAGFIFVLSGSLVAVTAMWKRQQALVHAYSTGLRMAGVGKLGVVERDLGRLEQAEQAFAHQLQISKLGDQTDLPIQLMTYDARHRLAELFYENNELEKGHAIAAEALSSFERLAAQNPNSFDVRRRAGFAHVLRGRQAYARSQWSDAHAAYGAAVALRRSLIREYPDSYALRAELAFALEFRGACEHFLLRQMDATESIMEAWEIYSDCLAASPASMDFQFALGRVALRLASCRFFDDDTVQGEYWLGEVKRIQRAISTADPHHERSWEHTKLARDIQTLQGWLDRQTGRTEHTDASP